MRSHLTNIGPGSTINFQICNLDNSSCCTTANYDSGINSADWNDIQTGLQDCQGRILGLNRPGDGQVVYVEHSGPGGAMTGDTCFLTGDLYAGMCDSLTFLPNENVRKQFFCRTMLQVANFHSNLL